MTVILLIVASVLALVGAAFFAGSETAFLSVSRERVLHLSREGGRKAKILQGILNDMSKTTTTLLIGNNLSSVIYSTATAALIADCVSGTTLQSVCSFLAAFTVLYVSEFLPKLLCAARPLRWSLSAAEPYLWCERALSPLVSIAMKLTNCFIRKRGDNRYQVTSADLVRILQDRKDGVRLSEFESALISRLIVLRIKNRRITVAEIFSALNGRQAMLAAFAALSVTVASAAGGVDIAPLPDKTGVMAGDGVFKDAKWIGIEGETEMEWRKNAAIVNRRMNGNESHSLFMDNPLPKNCPQLRKRFKLAEKEIASARVAVSGMGFYELWLNGEKADPTRFFAPGSVVNDTGFYDVYDVTRQLVRGENAIGLWLAPGYSDDFSRHGRIWFAPKRTILRLEVKYADGTEDCVVTDGSWQSRNETEIRYASIYHGETQDAGLSDPDWSAAGAPPRHGRAVSPRPLVGDVWKGVTVFPDGPMLKRFYPPPVRKSDPRHPVKVTRFGSTGGEYTLDFGQNRAGFVSISARGARGHAITVRTSELLGPNGRIDPWSSRRARSTDTFILAGTGKKENFEPHFTYHGFRYVEITGWPEATLDPKDVTAWALHADLKPTSSFACSDATLMKLHSAATWSMLSNMMSYPTDCCMRDERTPCRMDTQTYEDTACQMFDMRSYYAEWFVEGYKVAPQNPDWDGDAASLPFRLWRYYGERPMLERFWPCSRSMIDAMTAKHPDHIFTEGYGDWCAPNTGTWKSFFNDVEIVNTSLYCSFLKQLSETAADLGRVADAKTYAERFRAAKAAFHKKFYNAATASYGDGSQATYVMPFAFGLVPDDCRAAVKASLVKRIREHDRGRMDVGIYGTRYLGDVLCDLGECDLLVDMMTQTNYAGFGNILAQGATTLWEQWKPKGGMHSHNHAMLSGGVSWLYTHLAGIRPAKPGYAEILIQPCFPKRLDFVEAMRETPHGKISVRWKRTTEGVRINVTTPKDVPASVRLPDGSEQKFQMRYNSVYSKVGDIS